MRWDFAYFFAFCADACRPFGSAGPSMLSLPEMSDEDALNGIDFARLVGFPLDGLPDDADPHKATAFFESLGLSADFTGMDFDAAPAPASADDDAAKTHSGDGGHVAV